MLFFAVTLPFFSAALANTSEVPPPVGDGPYQAGWIDAMVPKTGGGTLPIAVYYPSIGLGKDANPNSTGAPYPALFFSPGFETTLDNYRTIAATVTRWGFVFTIVGSTAGVWDIERVSDLNDTLNWLGEQNRNSSFVLSQLVDEFKFGVMGHSLGGAAAIALSLSDSRVKVLVPIAAYIYYPMTLMSTESSANIHIPTYSMVGSDDTISPPSSMGYPFYNSGNVPKFCVTLVGENHFTIINTCASYIVSFLEVYLMENQEYARYVYGIDAQQEVLSGKIGLRYDLKKTVNYSAANNGATYNVSVYSDSTFLTFLYNETMHKMDFTLTGAPYTSGSANVSIPNQLVGEYNITVHFDDQVYPNALTSDPEYYHVYLTYNHSVVDSLSIELIDVTPPQVSIISPTADSLSNRSNVTVAWQGEDEASGLDHFEVKIDEETWIYIGNSSNFTFEGLTDGDHVAYIEAFDEAGNNGTVHVAFIVDTTPPSVAVILPASGSVLYSANVTTSWNASDAGSGIEYYEARLDEGQWMNVGLSTSQFFADLSDGNHTVSIRAVDKAGNPSETQIVFTVQTSPQGIPPLTQWLLFAAAGGIITSLCVAIVLRRRKSRSP
jgi:predicted dienelactone hydrolase